MDWREVLTQVLTLSREGRFEELRDFLARNGISLLGDSPCIVRRAFIVLCVGDRVTVYYRGGVRTGVIAGFSMDGTSLLLIGCRGERMCQGVSPANVYLPQVSSIVFREFSPFHLTYGARMLQEFIGSVEEPSEGG